MKKIFAVLLTVVIAASSLFIVVSAKDPDTWLCAPGDSFSTGWWFHPIPAKDWECSVSFTTPNAFDGMYYAAFSCEGEGVTVKIEVLDESGAVVDSVESQVVGNHNTSANAIEVRFQKAHAAGAYTIRFTPTDKYDNDKAHWVLASAAAGDIATEVVGNAATNGDTLAAPAILLVGCDAPSAEQPGEQPGEPAPTSDAAIIAVAALGCIALAGAVVAKKVK